MSKILPVHWKTLEKVFCSCGFKFMRQKGSHRSYEREGIKRTVVIPTYSEVPVFIILNNLKTAGIDRDQYFELLRKIK